MDNLFENQVDIGRRLKEVRESLGQSQEEFAKTLLGTSNKATISKYELGKLPIASKAEVVLFTTLGISKDWLYEGVGEMHSTNKGLLSQLGQAWEKLKSDLALGKDDADAKENRLKMDQIITTLKNSTEEIKKRTDKK